MGRIRELLTTGEIALDGHVIAKGGHGVGILLPSLLFGFERDRLRVVGPKGCAEAPFDAHEMWAAILSVGGVLLGSPVEIVSVVDHLEEASTSRTFSYLLCCVQNCGQALEAYAKFRDSRVTFLGCGGIGSMAAVLLAGAGLRSITLVDADRIEASNLNRQIFFTRQSIGEFKVVALEQELERRFQGLRINTVISTITSDILPCICKDADGIFLAADYPIGIVTATQDFAQQSKLTFVHAGYNAQGAIVSSSVKIQASETEWVPLPDAIMPSFGPLNAELGGLGAMLLFNILCGIHPPQHLFQTFLWSGLALPRTFRTLID